MKTFMLRGNQKKAISGTLPCSLKYGVWYQLVTPFDTHYFKLVKGSKRVHIYDFIGDKVPDFTVSRKKFIRKILPLVKGSFSADEYYILKN